MTYVIIFLACLWKDFAQRHKFVFVFSAKANGRKDVKMKAHWRVFCIDFVQSKQLLFTILSNFWSFPQSSDHVAPEPCLRWQVFGWGVDVIISVRQHFFPPPFESRSDEGRRSVKAYKSHFFPRVASEKGTSPPEQKRQPSLKYWWDGAFSVCDGKMTPAPLVEDGVLFQRHLW